MQRAQFEPPYAAPIRGKIEGVRHGVLHGWAWSEEHPTVRVGLEILIDDEPFRGTIADRLRSDLIRHKIGDGRHAFAVRLPDWVYDGRPHRLSARVSTTTEAIRNPVDGLVLAPDLRPAFDGCVVDCQHGEVRGYCRAIAGDAGPVAVDVYCNGRLRLTIPATSDFGSPEFPEGRGFSFSLAEAAEQDVLTDEISVSVYGSAAPLRSHLGHLGKASAAIEVDATREDIVIGRATVPGPTTSQLDLGLLVDGRRTLDLARTGVREGVSEFSFAAPIAPARTVVLELEADGVALPASRTSVRCAPTSGFVANACFDHWRGAQLCDWTLPSPVVQVRPTSPPLAAMAEREAWLGGGAARVLVGDAANITTLLEQTLGELPDRRTEELELLVCARASRACRLTVGLEEDDQIFAEVKAPVWPSWSLFRTRISASDALAASRRGPHMLRLRLDESGVDWIDFSVVAVGPPGFTPSASGHATIASDAGRVEAVANHEFAVWDGALSQTIARGERKLTDGWTARGRKLERPVHVSLDRIAVRDPARGVEMRKAYAIALAGSATGGYFRIKARLDPLQCRLGEIERLSFFAKATEPMLISNIFVMRRKTSDSAPEEYVDTICCRIGRKVRIDQQDRMVELPVPREARDALRACASEALTTQGLELLLTFEFQQAFDCALACVSLGPLDDKSGAEDQAYVALEDQRLLEHAHRTKMIGHWAGEAELQPRAARLGRTDLPARWSQPASNIGTVDIVVCVYNALEDVMRCLRSIERETTTAHRLIIVDDGSDVPTMLALQDFACGKPWVALKRNDQTLGYTKSANIGLANSTASWCVLMNSDTIVTPGWLEGMIACAASDPATGFVGPLSNAASWQSVPETKDAAGGWMVNALPPGMEPADVSDVVREVSSQSYPKAPLLNGFCMMMRRSVLETLGFLDETVFPQGYGEETDLCLRAKAAGYALAIADDVYVYHAKSASFGSERRRMLSREGNRSLARKHPDVRLDELEKEFSELTPLIEIRKALRRRFGPEMQSRKLGRLEQPECIEGS